MLANVTNVGGGGKRSADHPQPGGVDLASAGARTGGGVGSQYRLTGQTDEQNLASMENRLHRVLETHLRQEEWFHTHNEALCDLIAQLNIICEKVVPSIRLQPPQPYQHPTTTVVTPGTSSHDDAGGQRGAQTDSRRRDSNNSIVGKGVGVGGVGGQQQANATHGVVAPVLLPAASALHPQISHTELLRALYAGELPLETLGAGGVLQQLVDVLSPSSMGKFKSGMGCLPLLPTLAAGLLVPKRAAHCFLLLNEVYCCFPELASGMGRDHAAGRAETSQVLRSLSKVVGDRSLLSVLEKCHLTKETLVTLKTFLQSALQQQQQPTGDRSGTVGAHSTEGRAGGW